MPMEEIMNSCICSDCGAEFLFSGKPLGRCLSCFSSKVQLMNKNYNIDMNLLGKATVNKDDFQKKVNNDLLQGVLTPDDISKNTQILECSRLYIPYYKYIVSYTGSFSASIGYDYIVDFTEYEDVTKKDKNGNEYQVKVPVHKQRTETNWQPYSGSVEGKKSFYHIASNRFFDIAGFINEASQCTHVENSNFDNIVIEKIELSHNKIFQSRCEDSLRNHVNNEIEKSLPGDKSRDLKRSINYTINTHNLDFELIWIALCNYKGNFFRYVCDSNNVNKIKLIGKKPIDTERKTRIEKLATPFKVVIFFKLLILLSTIGYCFYSHINMFDIFKVPLVAKLLVAGTISLSIIFLIFGSILRRKRASIIKDSKLSRGLVPGNESKCFILYDNTVSKSITLTLCYFFGFIGVHRFYTKKTFTGILFIIGLVISVFLFFQGSHYGNYTVGVLSIFYFIDYFRILVGNFTYNEKYIEDW
jgi:TM2 domain-containing membrane protein YozV